MTGDPNRSPLLEEWFPDLVDWGYRLTSDVDFEYNCIAWAAGDMTQQWWPVHGYWPPGIRRELCVEAFVEAYASLGYAVCESEGYEPEHEKIAIYADETGEATHATRQLDAERWTSKCGDFHDISHPLRAFEGSEYGRVVRIMKRRAAPGPAPPDRALAVPAIGDPADPSLATPA